MGQFVNTAETLVRSSRGGIDNLHKSKEIVKDLQSILRDMNKAMDLLIEETREEEKALNKNKIRV